MTGGNQAKTLTKSDLERWMSAPRLARYLGACGGDLRLTLQLYFWNAEVAAAALAETCHLEVALRNAYDYQLCRQYPDWAIDPASRAFRRTQGLVAAVEKQQADNARSLKALADASRGLGANPTHGQVVAATTFGFWTQLTTRERNPLFWAPMLNHAFPSGTTRGQVHALVSKVNKFRNRLAHNEPVFSSRTGLRDRLSEVRQLMNLVDPTVAAFVAQASRVDKTVAACPVPGLLP